MHIDRRACLALAGGAVALTASSATCAEPLPVATRVLGGDPAYGPALAALRNYAADELTA